MKQTIYHLHTISSLHVGIGQGTGVIDLPIARERASNLPQIPGSGIKGVLRDELQDSLMQTNKDDYEALFGPEAGTKASEYAGAIAVGDARLLALPIRSWNGTFAWATCPMILHRYQRDLNSLNADKPTKIPKDIPVPNDETTIITTDSQLMDYNNAVFLEDLDLGVDTEKDAEKWAEFIADQIFTDKDWQKIFKQRFAILPDNIFDFLSETATEIRARIKIEENTRTVEQGALWYEEYLPAETLLWGVIASDHSRKPDYKQDDEKLLNSLPSSERLQIGGNATVGSGQVRWIKGGK